MPPPAFSRQVKFRIENVFEPKPLELLMQMYGRCELSGQVVDYSDSGRQRDRFAIVEVSGVPGYVLVPVEALQSA